MKGIGGASGEAKVVVSIGYAHGTNIFEAKVGVSVGYAHGTNIFEAKAGVSVGYAHGTNIFEAKVGVRIGGLQKAGGAAEGGREREKTRRRGRAAPLCLCFRTKFACLREKCPSRTGEESVMGKSVCLPVRESERDAEWMIRGKEGG